MAVWPAPAPCAGCTRSAPGWAVLAERTATIATSPGSARAVCTNRTSPLSPPPLPGLAGINADRDSEDEEDADFQVGGCQCA